MKEKGLAAVLNYSRRIDGADLPPGRRARARRGTRPRPCGRRAGIPGRGPQRPPADRRVSAGDPPSQRPRGRARRLPAAALSPVGSRRNLRARRGGRLSLDRADDGRAGAGRGREGTGRRRPADPFRGLQSRPAGRLPRVGHRGSLSHRRHPGRGRPGLRRRRDSARGQDCRAGQPLCRLGKETRLRRGGHRFDRRSQQGGRAGRSFDAAGVHGGRPDRPGRARPGRERLDRLGRDRVGRRRRRVGPAVGRAGTGASLRGRVSKNSGR